jgi:hypothetical protein
MAQLFTYVPSKSAAHGSVLATSDWLSTPTALYCAVQVDMCSNVTGITALPTTKEVNEQVSMLALLHSQPLAWNVQHIECVTVPNCLQCCYQHRLPQLPVLLLGILRLG